MDSDPMQASLDIQIIEQLTITTARLKKAGDSRIFKKFSLTTALFAILTKIAAGKTTIPEMQELIEGTPASLTQKLKQLEDREIIIRRLDESDKRRWIFDISDKGQRILAELHPAYAAQIRELLEPFSEKEKNAFLDVLRELENRLSV
jgi:MarR family transcriptional regulator, 2-MHQ and catechol-resistance regulon repressor